MMMSRVPMTTISPSLFVPNSALGKAGLIYYLNISREGINAFFNTKADRNMRELDLSP